MAKYVFVTGGVTSSLGKGITAASVGRILKARGLRVSILKLDPYINVDPGTMSPYQHGEVFVTDDGAETDLDLGHYERFIDENLSQLSNVTTGRIYQAVIAKVREIYGDDDACHPVTVSGLSAAFDSRRLDNEAGIRAADGGRFARWRYVMRTRAIVLLGWVLMRLGLRTQETDWSRYKETLVRNSDVRKFNDLFRQVLSGNAAQRAALCAWLEERWVRRELVYGVHVTDRAHMTCLVFTYAANHLHFIDGADGGFFLAAKAFKERVAAL